MIRHALIPLALAALLVAPATTASAQGCRGGRIGSPPILVRALSYGDACDGSLSTANSATIRGRYGDVWLFQGYAGDCVEITMRSSAVDSYLVLGRGNDPADVVAGRAVLAENDDVPGSLDASIRAQLPVRDKYYVVATTADGSSPALGPYSITLRQIAC